MHDAGPATSVVLREKRACVGIVYMTVSAPALELSCCHFRIARRNSLPLNTRNLSDEPASVGVHAILHTSSSSTSSRIDGIDEQAVHTNCVIDSRPWLPSCSPSPASPTCSTAIQTSIAEKECRVFVGLAETQSTLSVVDFLGLASNNKSNIA